MSIVSRLRAGSIAPIRGGGPGGAVVGWALLAACVVLELFATTSMKMLALTRNSAWNVGIYGGYSLCFALFTKVLARLPLGMAYATWCGVGTVGTVTIASLCFGEPMSLKKAACVLLTISGIVGLNFIDGGH